MPGLYFADGSIIWRTKVFVGEGGWDALEALKSRLLIK